MATMIMDLAQKIHERRLGVGDPCDECIAMARFQLTEENDLVDEHNDLIDEHNDLIDTGDTLHEQAEETTEADS